jgi:hypothetical protein
MDPERQRRRAPVLAETEMVDCAHARCWHKAANLKRKKGCMLAHTTLFLPTGALTGTALQREISATF